MWFVITKNLTTNKWKAKNITKIFNSFLRPEFKMYIYVLCKNIFVSQKNNFFLNIEFDVFVKLAVLMINVYS